MQRAEPSRSLSFQNILECQNQQKRSFSPRKTTSSLKIENIAYDTSKAYTVTYDQYGIREECNSLNVIITQEMDDAMKVLHGIWADVKQKYVVLSPCSSPTQLSTRFIVPVFSTIAVSCFFKSYNMVISYPWWYNIFGFTSIRRNQTSIFEVVNYHHLHTFQTSKV